MECAICANSSDNPSITINNDGLCGVCASYKTNYDPRALKKEMTWLRSMARRNDSYDAIVGISGGKDSTATLYQALKLGFHPLAMSFDTGYYPKHIFTRARKVARGLGVDYERVDARKYIRATDRKSFALTADLYDKPVSKELQRQFRALYEEGRRHYSARCAHALPFVRTCQLCRRIIIRAYYAKALEHNVQVVILGMNEWAGLSQHIKKGASRFSAVRKLQPTSDKLPVYVVHLPFLLGQNIADTRKILEDLGWHVPRGEAIVESNANSCLFARAAESKAKNMLGFHPDASRLSREVTVGFISKAQAKRALAKNHLSRKNVRQVLVDAGIIAIDKP